MLTVAAGGSAFELQVGLARAAVLAAAISLLLAVLVALYRTSLHPLAGVPGPRLAAFSNLWHAYHARGGQMLRLGAHLHETYGPVVRIGPNEVWLDSVDGFRSIYSAANGFEKSSFYLATALNRPKFDIGIKLQLADYDTLDFLSERNIHRYRLQRRLIGPTYQTTNLKKHEQAIDEVLERAVLQLRCLDGAEVDLKTWMHILTVECLGAIVLSWSPGYIRDKSDHGTGGQSYLGWRRKSLLGLFPLAVLANSYSRTLGRLLATLLGVTHRTPKNFRPFFAAVQRKVSGRIKSALRPKPPKDDKKDLMADLIELHKQRPEFNETYLRRLAITNFGAGHETMTSALTSTLAMIGSHPKVQQRMVDEIRTLTSPLTYDAAVNLPYTMACIKEAQRLYPAIGMSLPRTVPAGKGLHLHGHFFPPGTTVGCNPVSLHRNPAIFGADARSFRPERWLEADEAARRTMERCNLTWGGGGRTCPGRHLAELVLCKAVPRLLGEFRVEAVMPPEEEICYYFMAILTGVKARFLPRVTP